MILKSFQELPADPYLYLVNENRAWKFVIQEHRRGLSVHWDLRFAVSNQLLIGWTLNIVKGLKHEPKNLTEARKQVKEHLDKAFQELLNPNIKIVCEKKSPEPYEWLNVESWFPPGTVGSTRFRSGSMIICDKGIVEFGVQKVSFHEYFIWGKNLKGRFIVRQLPNVWHKKSLETGEVEKTGRGHTVWMCFFADPEPYVLSKRAVTKEWYPPEGKSCLPKYIRAQIPPTFRYWKKRRVKAHKLRNNLVDAIKSKEVTLRFTN